MRAYVLKRLLVTPLTLLGVTLVTFVLIKMAPGDPSAAVVGEGGEGASGSELSEESIRRWVEQRHLDRPVYEQYAYWVRDLATLNLGASYLPPYTKVADLLWERAPVTIGLNVVAFFVIYAIALPIGIICGVKQFSIWDRVLTVGVFMLYSMPSFWVATMLIYFFTKPDWPGLPVSGFYPGELREVGLGVWLNEWAYAGALPVICMVYAGFAFLSRQMRSSLLETIRQDYVRTARAKGLPERVVILKHAVRNSLIPVVTLIGAIIPAMVVGSVIIENVFSIPGMGMLFFDAILKRDYPVVMGELVLSAVLVMVGMLVSDILYVVVNPAISYD